MATVSYHLCDRCKGEISPRSTKIAKVPRYRPTKILWIVTGYVIEGNEELCGDCTLKLEEFLANK